MSNPTLIKNFLAEAAVGANRIVKFGTADNQVVVSAAVSDTMFGVSTELAAAINERCDVIVGGIAEVVLGGSVTRGAYVTSDASGAGLAAAPSAGTNNSIIGQALMSGVSGDVIPVLVSPGRIQG